MRAALYERIANIIVGVVLGAIIPFLGLVIWSVAKAEPVEVGVLTASPGCKNGSFAAGPANGPLQMRLLCDQAVVVVPACPSPPGAGPCPITPPGGPIACPGFPRTLVIDAKVPDGTTGVNRYYTESYGGFYSADALVLRFTAPATGDAYFRINLTESGTATGAAAFRTISLSSAACDFNPASASALVPADTGQGASYTLTTVAGQPGIQLVAGRTYYVNVKNSVGNVMTVPAGGRGDMLFNVGT